MKSILLITLLLVESVAFAHVVGAKKDGEKIEFWSKETGQSYSSKGFIDEDGTFDFSNETVKAGVVESDTISEASAGSGVTIDGMTIKDGGIGGSIVVNGTVNAQSIVGQTSVFGYTVNATNNLKTNLIGEYNSGSGVTVDGVLLKDRTASVDTINENTLENGVDIESVHIEDQAISNATTIAASTSVITDKVQADTMTNEDGNGSPRFDYGLKTATDTTYTQSVLTNYIELDTTISCIDDKCNGSDLAVSFVRVGRVVTLNIELDFNPSPLVAGVFISTVTDSIPEFARPANQMTFKAMGGSILQEVQIRLTTSNSNIQIFCSDKTSTITCDNIGAAGWTAVSYIVP